VKESLSVGHKLGFGQTGHGVCVRDAAEMTSLLVEELGELVLGLAEAQKQDGIGRRQMLDDFFVEALPLLMRMCLEAVYQPAPGAFRLWTLAVDLYPVVR